MSNRKKNINLLIVDDELDFYRDFRAQPDLAVATASTTRNGLKTIAKETFDAVFLDLSYSKEGINFNQGLNEILPEFVANIKGEYPIIVVTNDNRTSTFQRAFANGASHILKKANYTSAEEWMRIVKEVVQSFQKDNIATLSKEKISQRNVSTAPGSAEKDNFITATPALEEIKKRLKAIASFPDYPVLLLGESGTGKEVAARYLHQCGGEQRPFQAINLSAIGSDTFSSEVFGSVKGAFTDAVDRVGLLEAASGGVLLLDEIGEINLETQVKLLRVLQEKKFRRVGSNKEIKLDAQLVFATNKNLEEAITNGTFRRDFYERIRAIAVELPPLRERPKDIPNLIRFFIAQIDVRPKGHPLTGKTLEECFERSIIEKLQAYSWPGNIRELRGVIQSLMVDVIFKGIKKIGVEHLPRRFFQPVSQPKEVQSTNETVQQQVPATPINQNNWTVDKSTAYRELRQVEQALIDAGGRKNDAAEALGMKNDQTLRYKVKKKYYLDFPELFEEFKSICRAYKLAPGFSESLNVFLCYARKDQDVLDGIKKQLRTLDGRYPLRIWYDGEIIPGEQWDNVIRDRLAITDVYLLLLTPSMLASEYVLDVELKKAFKRHKAGQAQIIPIVCKACNWRSQDQLANLQVLPDNATPVYSQDRNEALLQVIQGIERTIKRIYHTE